MYHAEAELLPLRKRLILSQCPSLGAFLLAAKGVEKSRAVRGCSSLHWPGPKPGLALGGAGGYSFSRLLLTSLLVGMADLQLPVTPLGAEESRIPVCLVFSLLFICGGRISEACGPIVQPRDAEATIISLSNLAHVPMYRCRPASRLHA